MGGNTRSSTSSGASSTGGRPGTIARRIPVRTKRMAGGRLSRFAMTAVGATTASSKTSTWIVAIIGKLVASAWWGLSWWLRRQALITRSPYWWRRYNYCVGYYYAVADQKRPRKRRGLFYGIIGNVVQARHANPSSPTGRLQSGNRPEPVLS